jgi:hypothetical protein
MPPAPAALRHRARAKAAMIATTLDMIRDAGRRQRTATD